ncbi:MAG: Uma2 family endonuclease [Anaerolineae bacterium]|nr:Uma2 family endonuclease [Anaerolineae bacterium]
MVTSTKNRISAEQYLQSAETNIPQELLDGEVIVTASPINAHQRMVGRVYQLLLSLIPNGEVILSPSDVYLDEWNVVQPDLFWIAENSPCQDVDTHFVGAPTLIIEVLSPSTAKRDKIQKFRLYEKNRVPEYWLVDVDEGHIEVWSLHDEKYAFIGRYTSEESFVSPILGQKSVRVGEIF